MSVTCQRIVPAIVASLPVFSRPTALRLDQHCSMRAWPAHQCRGAKSLVHWWYFPDSYDEAIDPDDAPEVIEADKQPEGESAQARHPQDIYLCVALH